MILGVTAVVGKEYTWLKARVRLLANRHSYTVYWQNPEKCRRIILWELQYSQSKIQTYSTFVQVLAPRLCLMTGEWSCKSIECLGIWPEMPTVTGNVIPGCRAFLPICDGTALLASGGLRTATLPPSLLCIHILCVRAAADRIPVVVVGGDGGCFGHASFSQRMRSWGGPRLLCSCPLCGGKIPSLLIRFNSGAVYGQCSSILCVSANCLSSLFLSLAFSKIFLRP